MKRGGLAVLVVLILVVLAIIGSVSGAYNKLVAAHETVKNSWAQVDNQLQRRNDLIGNLVQSVKGTAIQEQQVFGQIANARAALAGARTPQDRVAAGQQMDQALGGPTLGRLLVVVENYPQLKSNEAFTQLMDELAGTENRLATERKRYNDQVKDYNVLVKQFPMNLYAGFFHGDFAPFPYYPIADTARVVPNVNFDGLRNNGPSGTPPPTK